MRTVTRKDLAKELHHKLREMEGWEIPIYRLNRILDYALDLITEKIKEGQKVKLRNFGIFYPKTRYYKSLIKGGYHEGEIETIGFKTRLRFKRHEAKKI